jgi:hypothetical protein
MRCEEIYWTWGEVLNVLTNKLLLNDDKACILLSCHVTISRGKHSMNLDEMHYLILSL